MGVAALKLGTIQLGRWLVTPSWEGSGWEIQNVDLEGLFFRVGHKAIAIEMARKLNQRDQEESKA
jgi:hypothetical protein